MASASFTTPMVTAPPCAPYNVDARWRDRNIAAKKWRCPCGKVLPTPMGPSRKAFPEVHSKLEEHKSWLRYGKVVADYFPRATPTAAAPQLGMMIGVNE